ncbi:amidohydrolase [Niabella beijingensis]|uniref:amidohydrolase n=1 Tax=Niabella beijingensis TaxID=2872700 RepID=UPI001CBFFBF9|nr:amidohydrolase [Niabella beijingensis]MBZ4189207.1 amidohydrolase [Niabella beijingensis]
MSLIITLVQTRLHWEDQAANLAMLRQKIENIQERTQVVILPEMFSTGFSMQPEQLAETMDGPSVQWMKETAAKKNIILTGSLIIKDGNDYYNRLIWMLPNGKYGVYDKRHRFAFAKEDQHYAAGGKRLIASVNGWKINLQVCYDLRFPVWTRQNPASPEAAASGPEYDVLINVANWPRRRSLAWKTLLQARAIENQCYVVGVNRVGEDGNGIYHSGDSRVIDPLGEILYEKTDEEDIFTITLHKTKLDEVRSKFPFWKDADGFVIY